MTGTPLERASDVDVAVVGGGPAGRTAALRAARSGAAVCLFEPRRDLDKPCGEGLMPDGVEALRELGVSVSGREFGRLRYVLSSGGELALELAPAGLAVPRPALLGALDRALAATGAEVVPRGVRVERDGEAFRLDDGTATRRARTVVVADGAHGRTAAWLGRHGAPTRRFGVRARFDEARPLHGVEVHLGGPLEVYLTPLPGARVNVAVLGHGRPEADALGRALALYPAARTRLGAAVTPPRAQALTDARPDRVAGGGAFLAGDACGAVDPILGCGVTIALRTSVAAADAALRVLSGEEPAHVARDHARAVARELSGRRSLARLLARLAPHPRLLAPVAAIGRLAPILFEPAVRIAAGRRRRGFVHAPARTAE